FPRPAIQTVASERITERFTIIFSALHTVSPFRTALSTLSHNISGKQYKSIGFDKCFLISKRLFLALSRVRLAKSIEQFGFIKIS
ncbi:MAG: hypothetical protein ACUVWN_16645, partial [bacterium]